MTHIDVHKCTKSDYEKFSQPKKGNEKSINHLKSSNEMFCLNKEDRFGNPIDFSIYGYESTVNSRELIIMYRPCIPTNRTAVT